ncbi:ankyrin repeat-containing domain protein [Mycena rebaudengoi]|nr:ankyrin repeat-containing domain protein [Mycena rebaudengoi]
MAAREKCPEILTLLLEKGEYCGEYGTPLQGAAEGGRTEAVALLLNKGADPNINIEGGTYGTALEAAAYMQRREIVALLLKMGANVNIRGEDINWFNRDETQMKHGGEYGSALHAAAYAKKRDIVALLLDKVLVSICKTRGSTYVFGYAWVAWYTGGSHMLSQCDYIGLHRVAQCGPTATYLNYDKLVDCHTMRGCLKRSEMVCRQRHVRLVPHQRAKHAITLVIMATSELTLRIIAQRLTWKIPLQAYQCKLELFSNLVYLGLPWANPGSTKVSQGSQQGTPLQAAAVGNGIEVTKLLLKKNANPNIQCGPYGTALQAAAYVGNLKIVELLLGNGADQNIQDRPYLAKRAWLCILAPSSGACVLETDDEKLPSLGNIAVPTVVVFVQHCHTFVNCFEEQCDKCMNTEVPPFAFGLRYSITFWRWWGGRGLNEPMQLIQSFGELRGKSWDE